MCGLHVLRRSSDIPKKISAVRVRSPLALSTTKPVAYELPALSVSNARTPVTCRPGESEVGLLLTRKRRAG